MMKRGQSESVVNPYFVQKLDGLPSEDYHGDGDSMYPILRDRDVVSLQKLSYNELKSGMIVVYQVDQFTRVCHYLVRFEDDIGWVSKGVNNQFEDSTFVVESNYIGVLTR